MKIYATPTFSRQSYKFIEKYPILNGKLKEVLELLVKNPFDRKLKTHKLHGSLKNFYACRISFDQRIVFELSQDMITLRGIGSHDQIY